MRKSTTRLSFFEDSTPVPVPVVKKPYEVAVEARLCKKVKTHLKGRCYKWSSQNVRGVPDRLIVLPGGVVWFIELKRSHSSRLSPAQQKFRDEISELKMHRYAVLHGFDEVDAWIDARIAEKPAGSL